MPQSGKPARMRPPPKSGASSRLRRQRAAPVTAAGKNSPPAAAGDSASAAATGSPAASVAESSAEAEARSALARFAAVFDSTPNVAIQGLARDGSVRHWNPASRTLYGYTEAEALGQKIHNLLGFAPQDRRRFLSEVKRIWQTREAVPPVERAIRTKAGDTRWIYSTISPVYEADRVVELFCMDVDVTARKQAEEALLDSTREIRALQGAIPDGLLVADAETRRILQANANACDLFGYSEEEFLTKRVDDLHPPERFESVRAHFEAMMRGEETLAPELPCRRRDGSEFPADIAARPLTIKGRACLLGLFRDVRDRQKPREDLDRYFTNSLDLLCIADTEGNFRRLNPAWERTLGYNLRDLEGHHFLDFVHPDDVPSTLEAVTRLASQSTVLNFTNRYRHKDGSYRWIEWRSFPEGEIIYAVARDVTASRELEQALQESEERYRQISENSPMGMHLYELQPDDRLVFIGANPAADRILGIDHAALIGRTIEEAFPDLIHTEVPARYRAAARTGIPWSTEQIEYEDAQIRGAFEVWAFPTQPNRMAAMFADVAARKRTENALTGSEAKLRSLFRAVPTGIGVVRDRILIEVNARICEMTGYIREELIGRSSRMLYPTQEEFDYVGTEKYRQIIERDIGTVETRWQRKDGTLLRVLLSSAPIDPNDLGVGVTFTALDITEREKIVEALRQSEEKFQRAFQSSPVLMAISTAEEGRFLDVNECFLSTLGYRREEVVGRTSRELGMFVEPAVREVALAAMLKKGAPTDDDILIRTKSGQIRQGAFSAETIELQGRPYLLTVMNDMTERRQLIAELTQKNKELETLIYVASHDLRSPLVNVQGFSGWLGEGYGELKQILAEARTIEEARDKTASLFDDRLPSSLNFIRAGVAKMDKLIDGLLRLSRAGRSTLRLETLDMNHLLESIIAASAYQIQEAGAQVELTPLPACRGDSGLINQVFSNLLDNALKYRDADRPLRIRVSGNVDKDRMVYTVADSGRGISTENLEKIWAVFWRLDSDAPQRVGEGLGLPMARRIVERHHGTMWAESRLGEGTRFVIDMPSGRGDASRPVPPTGGSKK